MYIARNYILITFALICSLSAFASDIKGDLDNDGKLTTADISTFADILIGNKKTSIAEAQLDFNSDGTISIGDLTKLIDIIANKSESGLNVGIDGWEDCGEDLGGILAAPLGRSNEICVICPSSTMMTGQHQTLSLALDNSITVNALLLTIKVPSGLQFEEVNFAYCTLLRNSSTHVVKTRLTDDGDLRVLAYATDNVAFVDSDGDILQVNVLATDSREFTLGVVDAEFSDAKFGTLYVDDVMPTASPIIRTISYYVDGILYQTQEYEYGAQVTAIDDPVKDGYTFSGWQDVPATMPAEDVVVYGSFEAGIEDVVAAEDNGYNVYSVQGHVIRHRASSIDDLKPGIYIINSHKVLITR